MLHHLKVVRKDLEQQLNSKWAKWLSLAQKKKRKMAKKSLTMSRQEQERVLLEQHDHQSVLRYGMCNGTWVTGDFLTLSPAAAPPPPLVCLCGAGVWVWGSNPPVDCMAAPHQGRFYEGGQTKRAVALWVQSRDAPQYYRRCSSWQPQKSRKGL